MKPKTQIGLGFVFMALWIVIEVVAVANYMTEHTEALAKFLFNLALPAVWLVWCILQIRNGRRRLCEEEEKGLERQG